MAVDPPLVVAPIGRDFPDDALSSIAEDLTEYLPQLVENWNDVGTFDVGLLSAIYGAIWSSAKRSRPQSLVRFDQFKRNATKKSASGFIDLLKKALKGGSKDLWRTVVTHGMSP